MIRSSFRVHSISILQRAGPLKHVTYRSRSSKADAKARSKASNTAPGSAAPPPQPRRSRWVYAWYGVLLVGGASAGLVVRNFLSPALPVPGSREDELALAALTTDIDKLGIVEWMRSKCSPSDESVDAQKRPGWVELDVKSYIAESKDEDEKKTRTFTGQTLVGSKGLGVQRAFWNTETKELVAVVWIGTALSGWPTIAHGGAIATIFEDCMARMVTGPDASIDSVAQPTSMSITYAKPTYSTNFYILRANYSKPNLPQTAPPQDPYPAPAKSWLPFWKDLTKKEQPVDAKKSVEIIGTLESIDGELTVRVKATFPVSN
ncbi:hypothetical protein BU23DRAFT_451246 [Bimuria novae-zelandiae CBS 107.79]|uniref:Thioesterase domain-containing protein n=1 Tax=Bimuria novae-zelandiae CBS 107.79 TaxID=1447943 RepID=A0A6A5VRD5_9PLEO|nr:hypothetical protein BU23DRAFT_451246 [Bimuria novae-zelandiae CBS 107.79]